MYKLAVLDIDGTLIDNKGNISKKTIQTISEVQQSGGIVTICTGRNIRKALPIAKKADIKVPIGCIDGAILIEPETKNIVEGLELSQYEIDLILSAAQSKQVFVELNTGYIYHKFAENENDYRYDIFNKRTPIGRIKSYMGGVRYIKSFPQLKAITSPIYQIVIAGKTDIISEIKDKADITIIDFHAEATAEKIAMGYYLDGEVTAIFGTHTHVQTADEKILEKGTVILILENIYGINIFL